MACSNLLFSWQDVILPAGLMLSGSEAMTHCYKVREGGPSGLEESCRISVRRFRGVGVN
jgi:hypothetical protein